MATRMGTLSYGRQFLLFRSPASRAEGHWFARYAHAVMCVAAATVLRACLGRMGVSPPYITYFPAVALAAWVNGMGPGIVATILAALCSDFFFIQPVMKLGISSAGEYLAHVVFIAMSLAISALAAWSRITDGALQQRTRELDEAQLVAGLGSWTLDAASGAVTWSRGLYRLAGREPGGGAPVLPYCLCTEESRERMRQAVEQCMGTGWPYELEAELAHPGGATRWVISRGTAECDSSGRAFRLRGTLLDITEQRRVDLVQLEEEQLRRALLDRLDEGVVACNSAGILVHLDGAAREIHGRPFEPIAPEEWASHYGLYLPDGVTALPLESNPLYRALQGESVEDAELVIRPPSGEPRFVVSNARPLLSSNGNRLGAVAAVRNVTKLRRTEAALREGEEHFRLIATHSPDIVYCQDRDLCFTWVHNPLPPYKAADLIGKTDAELPMPHLVGHITGVKKRVLETGQPWQAEILVSRQGTDRWFENHILPARSPGGEVRGLVGYARDITRSKQVELQLGEASRYARSLLEASLDPLVTISREGKITDVNAATEGATGVARSQLIGSDFSEYCSEPEQARRVYQRVFEQGSVRDYPLAIRHPSGRLTHVLYNATLFRDDRGEVTGVFAAARDITQRKMLEEQLLQSQKMEAVGRLAGGVAHDFNNLLTVVNGYSDLLMASLPADDPARESVTEIRCAGERAAALTRQLLAFSRKQLMTPRVVNLNQVVAGVNTLLNRLIGEDVDLVVRPAQDLGMVWVDTARIEQVLMNLAVNARDAMPAGGTLRIATSNVHLEMGTRSRPPAAVPGDYVLLSVSDTGVGMDEETRRHAFEPFFTTKGPGEGSGLGLAIVYGIVAQSGGDIAVESAPGHGAAFNIYLPRVAARPDGGSVSQESAGVARGTGTILVVEDSEPLARLTRAILESAGYRVLVATNGAEALHLAASYREPIRLLLTDIVLPGATDGIGVAARMRQARPETAVMYMSGYSHKLVAQGLSEADTVVLEKPFTPNALLEAVQRALNQAMAAGTHRITLENP